MENLINKLSYLFSKKKIIGGEKSITKSFDDFFYFCMDFSWIECIYIEVTKFITDVIIIFSREIVTETKKSDSEKYASFCTCSLDKTKFESGKYYFLWFIPTGITWEEENCEECGSYEGSVFAFRINHRYDKNLGIYASSIKPRYFLRQDY